MWNAPDGYVSHVAIKRGSDDSDLVWSSEQGDLRKDAGGPSGTSSRGTSRAGGRQGKKSRGGSSGRGAAGGGESGRGGRIKVRRETSGRRGKTVTTVSGIAMSDADIKLLAAELKKLCGVGGTARGGVVELQGDHRDKVLARLKEKGLDAVAAGG